MTNIQHNLENFLDSFSDSGHKYFVTAINTNLDDPLTWRICNGEVEFDSSTDYVDAWGNFCELDTTTVHVYYVWDDESEESDYIYAMPVKRMLEQKDFDHTNPDEDGWVYYPVPASDFVDKDPYNKLTPEAQEKWRKKLGL